MATVMTSNTALTLQIQPTDPSTPLGREQQRFNKLREQIDKASARLAAWHANIPPFIEARQARIVPMAIAMQPLQMTWLRELDRVIGERGWKKKERATLKDTLVEGALLLQEAQAEPDPEVDALLNKHSEDPFMGDHLPGDHEATLDMIQEITGIDLSDIPADCTKDELIAHLQQKAQAQQAQEAAHASDSDTAQAKRPSKAQARKEAEAELTRQSLRDIYRKLVSALHPDREPDPVKKEARTALMQRVNQAYDQQDLLALLNLQLEIAQINTDDLAATAPQRLKLYNKALADQLADIQQQIKHIDYQFHMDFGVPFDTALHPDKLVKVLDRMAMDIQRARIALERDLIIFKDRTATRRWVHQEMTRFEFDALNGEWF
jgi:hypothetical protein